MKKIFAFTLILLVLFIAVFAYADDMVTYNLDALNMSIDVPAEWLTFTLDTDDSDPNLALLGIGADDLVADFESKSIYLNSLQTDPVVEIVVTMLAYDGSQDIFSFNRFSDSELESLGLEMVEGLEGETDADYTFTGTYNTDQAKFATYDLEQSYYGQTIYGHQFYTVINGQAINITMHSYDGPLSDEMRNLQYEIVDSVYFDTVLDIPEDTGFSWGKVALNAIIYGAIFFVATLILKKVKSKPKKKDSDFDLD